MENRISMAGNKTWICVPPPPVDQKSATLDLLRWQQFVLRIIIIIIIIQSLMYFTIHVFLDIYLLAYNK